MSEDPLRIELVRHLSAEVTSNISFLHTLRSRMAFNVLLGPFLVLGSFVVAATKTNISWPKGASAWVWLCLALLCYFGLGVYGYFLDRYLTGQCDFVRNTLLSIVKDRPLAEISLDFPKELKWNHGLAYLPGFAIVLLAFAGLTVFFLQILAH